MTTDPRIQAAVERELKRAPVPTPERLRRLAGLMGLAPAAQPEQQTDTKDDAA